MFAIFLAAQFLDGALTYWGIHHLGVGIEANTWLTTTIHAFGAAPALLGAKTLACVCGLILYLSARHRVLAAVAGIYVGVAVVPWLLLLAIASARQGVLP